jgi:hypothetical protein
MAGSNILNRIRSVFGGERPAGEQAVITVVSGLPRSGTSMMMKMLETGGIPPLTDKIRTPDDDNPKGYYEFERVKKLPEGDTAWLHDAAGKVVKIISQLILHLPEAHTYKVLFVQRRMHEILASQARMLQHRGEAAGSVSDEQMARFFEKHLHKVFSWMDERPYVSYLDVDYNQMLADPRPTLEQVNEFLGSTLDVDAMTAVVDPTLYRNRR